MLKTKLKQDIEQLNEAQLQQVAALVATLRKQSAQQPNRFWQRATPAERAAYFREWVKTLPRSSRSLPDEAFDRGNIYD
ncbi:MAG: hypothetical protein AAGG51_12440 [Cyanobacteria bacterium P01_G01_bin.54]